MEKPDIHRRPIKHWFLPKPSQCQLASNELNGNNIGFGDESWKLSVRLAAELLKQVGFRRFPEPPAWSVAAWRSASSLSCVPERRRRSIPSKLSARECGASRRTCRFRCGRQGAGTAVEWNFTRPQ